MDKLWLLLDNYNLFFTIKLYQVQRCFNLFTELSVIYIMETFHLEYYLEKKQTFPSFPRKS